MNIKDTNCKCGSNKVYKDCCGLYILGLKRPSLPEQLMRSRYTAYSIGNIEYIAKSMCGKAIKGFNIKEAEIWAQHVTWQKLEIVATQLVSKTKGFVEFKAFFIDNQQSHILHEISEFHLKNGKWFYVDGVVL